ncbi:beta-N-acetylhexosaminidase [Parapedobacter sp.]
MIVIKGNIKYLLGLFVALAALAHSPVHAQYVLPNPQHLEIQDKRIQLSTAVRVYLDKRIQADRAYVRELLTEVGFEPIFERRKQRADIVMQYDEGKAGEAYAIRTEEFGRGYTVQGYASTANGLIYALQSLRQLARKNGDEPIVELPMFEIEDAPYFGWRAFMLDESRHFHGKETVKRLLDELVRLKFNTFHWHLVDDPAWRIEIKKYPLLTEVSSKGDHTHMTKGITPAKWDSLYHGKPGSFYTQDDIREIVKYAAVRGIRIIPEIEVPGHASAAIYAYPWLGASSSALGKPVHGDLYNVTDPRVEQFLHDVLDEVIRLFPGGIVHIGGDEANYDHWRKSADINAFMAANGLPTYADLQVWAINRMSRYISSKGYRMIGWNEITGDNIRGEAHIEAGKSERLAEGTIVQFWDGDVSLVNKAISKGYDVVNSNRFFTYLDYPYEVTPLEKAYSFDPIPDGIATKDRHKILGLGCQLWGEFTPTVERLNFQAFPRLAAFAAIGWVSPERKLPYEVFLQHFQPIEAIWKEKGYLKDQLDKY